MLIHNIRADDITELLCQNIKAAFGHNMKGHRVVAVIKSRESQFSPLMVGSVTLQSAAADSTTVFVSSTDKNKQKKQ